MKVSTKTLAALLTAGLALGVAGSAFAYGSHGHGCDMGDQHTSSMRALYQLDSLTDEQRSKIKSLLKEERDSMRDLFDAMQDARDNMQEATQNNVSADKIEPLAKKQGELVTKMIVARAKLRDKINAILTEEQRKELSEMKTSKRRYDDNNRRYDQRVW